MQKEVNRTRSHKLHTRVSPQVFKQFVETYERLMLSRDGATEKALLYFNALHAIREGDQDAITTI